MSGNEKPKKKTIVDVKQIKKDREKAVNYDAIVQK